MLIFALSQLLFLDFRRQIVRCRYCGAKRQRGVFCSRFHTYEAWLIDRRDTIKLYVACVALYGVLIAYLSQ